MVQSVPKVAYLTICMILWHIRFVMYGTILFSLFMTIVNDTRKTLTAVSLSTKTVMFSYAGRVVRQGCYCCIMQVQFS